MRNLFFAITLAEQNMKKMGIDWVSFAGKRFAYRPETPGGALSLECGGHLGKGASESGSEKGPTGDRRPYSEAGPPWEAPPTAAWRYYEILMKIRSELKSNK